MVANLWFDAVCGVKNRLTGDFWRFYARSATKCWNRFPPGISGHIAAGIFVSDRLVSGVIFLTKKGVFCIFYTSKYTKFLQMEENYESQAFG
jgi:hypothetical protein